MKCEICDDPDPRLLMILPIPQSDGRLNTMACKNCAENSSTFCKRHNMLHQGFVDGSTACLICVNELAQENESRAGNILHCLSEALSKDQFEDLSQAAEDSSLTTGDPREVSVLRFIVCKAVRKGRTIDDVIGQLTADKSARFILW